MQGADADPGFSVCGIGVARAGRSRHESPCDPHPKRPESGAERPRRVRIRGGLRSVCGRFGSGSAMPRLGRADGRREKRPEKTRNTP